MATSQGLECPVCCESFDGQDVSPRLLISCGHSFCTGCLERLLATDDKITCPTCRVEVKVPQAGVAGLPKNWALLSLIAPDHEGVDGLPICEFCENKHPANSYCLDCEEDMCKNAARFHARNKTSRDHRIVSLEPSAVSVKCPKHDEQFRLFDVTRNCMICRSCFTGFGGRDVVSLHEAGSKCKKELEKLATKARSRAEVIKGAEEGVRDVSLDVKASCDEQCARIESVFEELRTAIETREKILLNELQQVHNRKTLILTEQRNRLRQYQENIESTVKDVLSTIQSLDNANLLDASANLESTLVDVEKQSFMLEPEAQCVPEFNLNRRRLQYLQDDVNKLGTVSDKSTCAETTTACGSGLERAKRGEEESFTINAFDAQGVQRNAGGDAFAVELKSGSGEKISVNVRDEKTGSYVVTYTIPSGAKRVDYTLSVRFRGAHIKGSPFTVHIASSLRRKTYKALSNAASKLTPR